MQPAASGRQRVTIVRALICFVIALSAIAAYPKFARAVSAQTVTFLSSNLNPSHTIDTVTFTAIVAASVNGAATGHVTFVLDNSINLGSPTIGSVGVGQPIAAGYIHTCALNGAGGVKCWGNNGNGQLGDGTGTSSTTPVDVSGLTTGVLGVTTSKGSFFSCAVTAAGAVKCWGDNTFGELGNGIIIDGTGHNSVTPVDVSGLSSNGVAVAAGNQHACALTKTGGVKCWGRNFFGQLGNGTTTDSSTPVDVVGLASGVQAIAVGGYTSCALMNAGGVLCWGFNADGELGDGTTTHSSTPGYVSGLTSGVTAISGGVFHFCAVTSAGGLKCWGSNTSGQLGNTSSPDHVPVDVSGLTSGMAAVAAGGSHTCALTTSGGTKCWGEGFWGELGDGNGTRSDTPVNVVGLPSTVSAISAGGTHTCAILSTAGVMCWGMNDFAFGTIGGMLGDGTFTNRLTPVNVTGMGGGSALVLSKAVISYSLFSAGSHTISASYGGDSGHASSVSSNLSQQVFGASNTTTTVSASPNPSVFGQSVNLTATISGGSPFGSVTFWDGSKILGTGTVSSGTASFDISSLATGAHSITAVFNGDQIDLPSTSAPLTQTVNQGATSTSLSISPEFPMFGQDVTFTATITVTSPASGTLTGTVTFYDGGTALGTGTGDIASGTVSFTTSALSIGDHTITAVYGNDSNHATSSSPPQIKTVTQDATTTAVVSSVNPTVVGQSTTFTATVASIVPDVGTPTGTVTFMDGDPVTGTILGTGPLSSGTATLTTAFSVHTNAAIYAVYNGDSQFATSTSTALIQFVDKGGTTTALGSSANPSVYGQPTTFTATVSVTAPASGTPTGSVTFKDGATIIGFGTLSSGTASFTPSSGFELSPGSHTITATYNTDTKFNSSTSSTLTQIVNKGATTTALSSSVNPSLAGHSVIFTATITPTAPAAGFLGGTATFMDGPTTLGSTSVGGPASHGIAHFTTSTLSDGSHAITVVYNGDANFTGSTSSALTQSVIDFSTGSKRRRRL